MTISGHPLGSEADMAHHRAIGQQTPRLTVSDIRLAEILHDYDNFYRPEIKAIAEELLATRKPNVDAALVEYRRWMPGHSGRIGNETFFVCREKDDGEVEWLARHPTAEAMRDDLDRRTVEAVIRAALGERGAPTESTASRVWKLVGECLAGMDHSEVSERARRKIEVAIQSALNP